MHFKYSSQELHSELILRFLITNTNLTCTWWYIVFIILSIVCWQEFRRKLPSWKTKEHVLKMVAENQVCVISGETGCGKTTQVRVSQFVLP